MGQPRACDVAGCSEQFQSNSGYYHHRRKVHGIHGQKRKRAKVAKKKVVEAAAKPKPNGLPRLVALNFCPHCGNRLPNAHVEVGHGT